MEVFKGLPGPDGEEVRGGVLASEGDARLENPGRPAGVQAKGVGYHWAPQNEKPVHDAIVDQLIATPQINAVQLAKLFGYSPQAMRMMLKSDMIREKLARKREDLVDPVLKTTLEDRFAVMLEISLERATEILSTTSDGELLLKGVDIGAKALGYGARPAGGGNNGPSVYVVNPGVAPNSKAWSDAYSPLARGGQVVDADIVEVSPMESVRPASDPA